MRKRFSMITAIVLLMLMNAVSVSANVNTDALELTAKTAILIEETTGRVLYAKDEHLKMYPASMTKILTALVAVDYFKPDDMIKIGTEINKVPPGSSLAGHTVGESILFENLLRALLIPSGNESALVIMVNVAKAEMDRDDLNFNDSMEIFSKLMNEKALSLGATESSFTSPNGLHDDSHYTTAYDMALISRAAMQNQLIRKIVAEQSFKGKGAGEANDPEIKTKEYNWSSRNLLISSDKYSYPYATGIKTGFTDEASDCLAASAQKDDKKLISVVFFAPDPSRWEDSKKLLDYGFNNYEYQTVVSRNEIITEAELSGQTLGDAGTLEIASEEAYIGYYSKAELDQIKLNISYDESLVMKSDKNEDSDIKLLAPITKYDVVGKATYTLNGAVIFETNVLASRDVEKRSVSKDIQYYWQTATGFMFSTNAIPYWIGGTVAIALIGITVSRIRRRRNRNFYKLRKRY